VEGDAQLVIDTGPPTEVALRAGESQVIPPEVAHQLGLGEGAIVAIDFLVRDGPR
jgi:mannose-6-phosphate isomerase-like protein (cupin superfamily)